MARKNHQDSAVRFVTANSWPEKATKTWQYDLLLPTERATETRQYDLLLPNVGQKEPPRLGSTICYGQELARKSHQDSAIRFVTAKRWPEEPPRLGSTICYGQTWARKSHRDSAVRFVTAKSWPERATETRQYDLLRLRPTERATKTRQYDLLRPRVVQKEPPRLGSTICHGEELARNSHRTICYGQELARKSHQDSALRFVTAKRGPRRGSTICYGQELARKSHRDSAVRFVTDKSWPERATKTRQYDLLRPNVGQKEPPRLGSTICYGQTCARKNYQDSAVRFVTAKNWPERATKTRQYDL